MLNFINTSCLRDIIGVSTLISVSGIASSVILGGRDFAIKRIVRIIYASGFGYAISATIAFIEAGIHRSDSLIKFSYLFALGATGLLVLGFIFYFIHVKIEPWWAKRKVKSKAKECQPKNQTETPSKKETDL